MNDAPDFDRLVSEPLVALRPEDNTRPVANISQFRIDVDSVVATATVVADKTMRRIRIDWGDGQIDTINHQPGVPIAPVFGKNEPLPAGHPLRTVGQPRS